MINNYRHSTETAIMLGLITEEDRVEYAHNRRKHKTGKAVDFNPFTNDPHCKSCRKQKNV